MNLTPRQKQAFDFICQHDTERGVAPTIAEIMVNLGLASKSGVVRILRGLEERQYIERIRGKNRAIKIIDRAGAETLLRDILHEIETVGYVDGLNDSIEAARRFVEARA